MPSATARHNHIPDPDFYPGFYLLMMEGDDWTGEGMLGVHANLNYIFLNSCLDAS